MILHYDKPLKIFAILLAIFFVTPRSSGENQSLAKDGAFDFLSQNLMRRRQSFIHDLSKPCALVPLQQQFRYKPTLRIFL